MQETTQTARRAAACAPRERRPIGRHYEGRESLNENTSHTDVTLFVYEHHQGLDGTKPFDTLPILPPAAKWRRWIETAGIHF